jgi:hypothetical protein
LIDDATNPKYRGTKTGYALYDVLLAMFCNEWTWVGLKRIQIERVERTKEDYGPVGVWEGKKRAKRCALTRLGKFAFRIILLARGR